MKGMAILFVVIGHIFMFSMEQSSNVAAQVIYAFHMPLFMFLSGIVAAKGITPPIWSIRKLLSKILALLLPMMVFGGIFSLTLGPTEDFADFCMSIVSFVNAPAKNGYWYLMTLAMFYLSMQFFRLNRCESGIVDVIIAVATWAVFLAGWKFSAQRIDPFCLLNCGNFYLFFILGVFTTKYELLPKLEERNWLLTAGMAGFLFFFLYTFPIHAMQSVVRHILLPFCALLVVVYLFLRRKNDTSFVERQLEYIGRNTLDIYVLHYFFVANINIEAAGRWMGESGNGFLAFVAAAALSVAVTYLSIAAGRMLHASHAVNRFVYGRDIFGKEKEQQTVSQLIN